VTNIGIDVGSVSTNLVVIDGEGSLIHSIYLRTNSRPIEVVRAGLPEIKEKLADRIQIMAVGTIGSGREMIGEIDHSLLRSKYQYSYWGTIRSVQRFPFSQSSRNRSISQAVRFPLAGSFR
jgi:predicted NBD/HSP70 family sugar kinase